MEAATARYGIAELAEAAGVSVRTVRYYIAEGLLPPPATAGARSTYTREHLDRLLVIGRLKDAFLPLKEIRRQLGAMDEAAIRELAEESAAPETFHEAAGAAGPAPTGFVHGREDIRPSPAPAAGRGHRVSEPDSASNYIRRLLGGGAQAPRPPHPHPVPRPLPPRPPAPTSPPDDAAWRRVRLGDDAELLIREEAYQRRREKVDWLIEWARKVFG